MNMKHKILLVTGSILILLFLAPLSGFCQGDPGCDPLDPACPIDGGLSLLIAAGVGLAAKKAYKSQKNQENASQNL